MTAIAPATTWYVYMIECANGHLYTGITTDVARRFAEHQSSGPKAAKYLKGKGPLALVYQEVSDSRSLASQREIAIKKLNRKQKLQLITDNKQA